MAITQTESGVTLLSYGAGPIHGDHAMRLYRALRGMPRSVNGPEVGRKIEGVTAFNRRFKGVTSDNFCWVVYEFRVPRGKVGVLIPPAEAWSCGSGYIFDRYPCAYIRGGASVQDAREVLTRVAQALDPSY